MKINKNRSPLFMVAQLPFNQTETVKLNTPMITMMDDKSNKLIAKKNLIDLGVYQDILKGDSSFLEIGCGRGYLLELLYENGDGKYFGIEPINSEYKLAIQKLKPFFGDKKGEALLKSRLQNKILEKSSFKKSKFDYIYSYHVFEHLENPLDMLSSAKKLLNKGGKLIITTPNVEGAVPRKDIDSWRCSLSSHRWLPGKETIIRAIENSGFSVVKYFTYGGYPAPRGFFKNMANNWYKLTNQGDVICIMIEESR